MSGQEAQHPPKLSRTLLKIQKELIQECGRHVVGGLSTKLYSKLEKLSAAQRKEIVRGKNINNFTPLIIACEARNVKICEELITLCGADIHQRLFYKNLELLSYRKSFFISPLMIGILNGNLPFIKLLLQHGADKNESFDAGITPLFAACHKSSNKEIVKILIENGANMYKVESKFGETCLMRSAISGNVAVCRFLLKSGAKIDEQDYLFNTAAHYAVQKDKIEIFKLFVQYGANFCIKNKQNEDVLTAVCVHKAKKIFEYIMQNEGMFHFTKQQIADAYDLMGAMYVGYKSKETLRLWAISKKIRATHKIVPDETFDDSDEKLLKFSHKLFNFLRTHKNLFDSDKYLQMESVAVRHRICGPSHKVSMEPLLVQFREFPGIRQKQRLIHFPSMWLYILYAVIKKYDNSLLIPFEGVRALFLYENFMFNGCYQQFHSLASFEDKLMMTNLLINELDKSMKLLSIKPVYLQQQKSFDVFLKHIMKSFYSIIKSATNEDEEQLVRECVKRALASNPRTIEGNTLLHLAMQKIYDTSKLGLLDGENRFNFNFVKFLIKCGADVNATNNEKSSILIYAAHPDRFNSEIVQFLLKAHANVVITNINGEQPYKLLTKLQNKSLEWKNRPEWSPTSLFKSTCSCIIKNNVPYDRLPNLIVEYMEKRERKFAAANNYYPN